MPLLELRDIHTSYGLIKVIFGISLRLHLKENVCLLGRNGVGKSTILRTIVGFLPVQSGSLHFDNVEITAMPIYERARLGIAYVPDDKGIWPNLTVFENLHLAGLRAKKGKNLSYILEAFPEFRPRLKQPAGMLSGGEQEMLSLARGLVVNPRLLVLDEISQGLAPMMLQRIVGLLSDIKKGGSTLLTEQNLDFGCEVADRVYVVDTGEVVFDGDVDELARSEAVRNYLSV